MRKQLAIERYKERTNDYPSYKIISEISSYSRINNEYHFPGKIVNKFSTFL